MNTNWTSPKRNIILGIAALYGALAAGSKARLTRAYNEECAHSIREKDPDQDFRNYAFSIGYFTSINKIKNDSNYNEFEKYLSLNYVSCFGSEEAMKRYYETGELGEDNFYNMGRCHLIQVDDMIKFLESTGDIQRANMYREQYRAPNSHANDIMHFFDFFRYKYGSPYAVKKFKHKLWVIETIEDEKKPAKIPVWVKIINTILYPIKYIPQKSVLRMSNYTNYTFSIGSVTNGFSIEFQIPKKFSFK